MKRKKIRIIKDEIKYETKYENKNQMNQSNC